MIPTSLVCGGSGGEREAAIAASLVPGLATTVIIEGLSDGNSALVGLAEPRTAEPRMAEPCLAVPPMTIRGPPVSLVRIAPGCLCCAGNLILRVTLNRVLQRDRPARLFISLANVAHIEQLRLWLSRAPYDRLLRLGADIKAGPAA